MDLRVQALERVQDANLNDLILGEVIPNPGPPRVGRVDLLDAQDNHDAHLEPLISSELGPGGGRHRLQSLEQSTSLDDASLGGKREEWGMRKAEVELPPRLILREGAEVGLNVRTAEIVEQRAFREELELGVSNALTPKSQDSRQSAQSKLHRRCYRLFRQRPSTRDPRWPCGLHSTVRRSLAGQPLRGRK